MRYQNDEQPPPIGLILAGGPGTRIGGGKPNVALRGDALLLYPLRAMQLTFSDVAVIVKPQTMLPRLEGAMIWVEPDEPTDPLLGICEGLALASGRAVVACPVDMPFVSARLLRMLAGAGGEGRPASLASFAGVPRALLGCYTAQSAPLLGEAVRSGAGLDDVLRDLDPHLIEVEDEDELFDVNTPDDLLQAAGMLDLRVSRR